MHGTPERPFSNGGWHKNVRTVGEVIDELSRLPRSVPVNGSFCEGIDIVLFNRGTSGEHVAFEDGGDWPEEDDDDESDED